MTDKMLYSESDMLKLSTSDAMADAREEFNKLLAQILAKPVKDIQLTARARKVMEFYDVYTVGDMHKLTIAEIKRRHNCGKATLAEIVACAASYGIQLRAA